MRKNIIAFVARLCRMSHYFNMLLIAYITKFYIAIYNYNIHNLSIYAY